MELFYRLLPVVRDVAEPTLPRPPAANRALNFPQNKPLDPGGQIIVSVLFTAFASPVKTWYSLLIVIKTKEGENMKLLRSLGGALSLAVLLGLLVSSVP